MCLKHKIIPLIVLLLLGCSLHAQDMADSLWMTRKMDSLSTEISLLKSRQQSTSIQIRNLSKEYRETIDSLLEDQNRLIRDTEQKIKEMSEEFEVQTSILQGEIIQQAEEREGIKRRFITASLLLFVLITVIFIYFFYRNYLMEKYIDERILKTSLETDSRLESLKSKILPRINKLKKRSKTTQRNLEQAEKKFSRLKKRK